MTLIKKLQECQNFSEAQPILDKLKAGPSARKLVETAIVLSKSPDPQQKEHAFSFMNTALKEIEDHMKEEHDKDKELPVKEEVLSNHNTGAREEGSEQSTDNTPPYPQQGMDSPNGEKPMQDMSGTENQFSEIGMMPDMIPGMDPTVAQEMGSVLPKLPPMNTAQMMKQMQYTLETYHKRMVGPMMKHIKQQREAILELSKELRETKQYSGSMKLDIDNLRSNAGASFRETVPSEESFQPIIDVRPHKGKSLQEIRSEISQLDKAMSKDNPMYG